MTMAIPRLFKSETKMGPIAHHLTILSREIRNRARMNQSTYRLVLILEKGKSQYYVERAAGKILINEESIKAEIEKSLNPNEKKDDDEAAPPPPFQIENGILKNPKQLPTNISITSLETNSSGGVVTEGKAFIHYSGEGLVEASVLQLTNSLNQTWSLYFNPLTGHVTVIEEPKRLSEVSQ